MQMVVMWGDASDAANGRSECKHHFATSMFGLKIGESTMKNWFMACNKNLFLCRTSYAAAVC
jgi:hypothetical protein